MSIDFLLETFRANKENEAIAWKGKTYTYDFLLTAIQGWRDALLMENILPGDVVALEADFSPNSMALMLTLIEHNCVIVPLTESVKSQKEEFCRIAQVEMVISLDQEDKASFHLIDNAVSHEILLSLKNKNRPGLVLFSSGSTGKCKAAVHDFIPILEKFKVKRHSKRMMTFLLFDHIGGVNTLLYTLSNAGLVVTVQERIPEAVCKAIQEFKVEILPVSPTFINLLLLSESYKSYDISSLEMVTYGTEPMPESTLKAFHTLFPEIRLLQTYGLSEVGILRSKSKSSDSLWVKIGGEGFETRVVNGMLEIKSNSAMLGYLNAPSPFTEDGWFMTKDLVEVDGEYYKILGRATEIINVGGQKVYPSEVESVILEMDGVMDCAVKGEPNSITGQIVSARVLLSTEEKSTEFKKRMRLFCKEKLPTFKIPQKIILEKDSFHSGRFKKMR